MKSALFIALFLISTVVSAQSLTYGQVYDFETGDVFCSIEEQGNPTYGPPTVYLDTVSAKSWSQNNDTVFYTFNRRETWYQPDGPPIITYSSFFRNYTNLDSAVVFGSGLTSCDPPSYDFYSGYCSEVWEYHSNQYSGCFEPTVWRLKVIKGAGGIFYHRIYGHEFDTRLELLYWIKGDSSCGNIPVGTNNHFALESKFKVYPNPADDFIILPGKSNAETIILNVAGQVVGVFGRKEEILDVSGLKKGLYFIRTEYNHDIFFSKFLKK